MSDLTGAPEMLGGRVKTLHPAVHGGTSCDNSRETYWLIDTHTAEWLNKYIKNHICGFWYYVANKEVFKQMSDVILKMRIFERHKDLLMFDCTWESNCFYMMNSMALWLYDSTITHFYNNDSTAQTKQNLGVIFVVSSYKCNRKF